MKPTPKQQLSSQFESKEKLIAQLLPLLEDKSADKKTLSKKLLNVSNKKLIRLYEVATEVKNQFGSKQKLVEAILSLKYGSNKIDANYQEKIQTYSIKRLYDIFHQTKKQNALSA